MEHKTAIVEAHLNDLSLLSNLCKETYSIYFGSYWDKNGLELYLEDQFGDSSLHSDLQSDNVQYYLIHYDHKPIGFMKVHLEATLDGFDTKQTCELEKMYIYPEYKGLGIGTFALQSLISKMKKKQKSYLVLDVLESNKSAFSFYQKLGFEYHSKTKVKAPYFKSKLSVLNVMILNL